MYSVLAADALSVDEKYKKNSQNGTPFLFSLIDYPFR